MIIMMTIVWSSLLVIFLPAVIAQEEEEVEANTIVLCSEDSVITFDVEKHKKTKFTVGVLAITGEEEAYAEFNATWNSYLTATAGKRFDPPLEFAMKALNFNLLFTDTRDAIVDFIYVNPSAYSCIESEYTAHSLASQISRRVIGGKVYDLNMFGGVIFARADNENVNTLKDIKGTTVAAASINGLGSGQMQFLEMQKARMSYINDPGQLVFTSNQEDVVTGVLNGDFDVGFVRTDQIEGSTYPNGTAIDPGLFKIINPQEVYLDGMPFPFESSTPLYPEWNIAALSHVHTDVQQAVQRAMLSLGDHASVAALQEECLQNNSNNNTLDDCVFDNFPRRRCDTTSDIARIAQEARTNGQYTAWSPTLSYMQLRSMQELTGFISLDPTDNTFKCTRSTTLYDSIVCPNNYYKATPEQVDQACDRAGLVCHDEYQCLCSPCVPIQECWNGVKMLDKCVPYSTLLPSILVPLFFIVLLLVHMYVEYRRKQADLVWSVDPEELQFQQPLQVVGRGTFGYVVLAEYRGTKVAVKKVLPSKTKQKQNKSTTGSSRHNVSHDSNEADDLENPTTKTDSHDLFLRTLRPNIPGFPSLEDVAHAGSLDFRSNSNPGLQSMAAKINSWTNSMGSHCKPNYKQLKKDFLREMRHLSKLRHPCITTVMGAVVSPKSEPMLVMEYMGRGSLYDVLRNMAIELDVDETIMPILQDIAQGVRFLHAASPQVVHGDLKSKNVLIDANFRAKVTDFGFSAKRPTSATGTPYWMSPELLRGESNNTACSDIYAFGILMFEIFSRADPYSGENHVEVLSGVCDPHIRKRPVMPPNCSYKTNELYRSCVAHNPCKRPTAESVDLCLRVEGSVKERTTRLEQANKKIEEAQKMQLEHIACMSHEIRTVSRCFC
jgi:serine/threonine protein kinase/ABC-type phosphate/phosphonate transport system substrate-binding protein